MRNLLLLLGLVLYTACSKPQDEVLDVPMQVPEPEYKCLNTVSSKSTDTLNRFEDGLRYEADAYIVNLNSSNVGYSVKASYYDSLEVGQCVDVVTTGANGNSTTVEQELLNEPNPEWELIEDEYVDFWSRSWGEMDEMDTYPVVLGTQFYKIRWSYDNLIFFNKQLQKGFHVSFYEDEGTLKPYVIFVDIPYEKYDEPQGGSTGTIRLDMQKTIKVIHNSNYQTYKQFTDAINLEFNKHFKGEDYE